MTAESDTGMTLTTVSATRAKVPTSPCSTHLPPSRLLGGKWRCIADMRIPTKLSVIELECLIFTIYPRLFFSTPISKDLHCIEQILQVLYCNPRTIMFYQDEGLWYLQEFLVITDWKYLVVIVINCYPSRDRPPPPPAMLWCKNAMQWRNINIFKWLDSSQELSLSSGSQHRDWFIIILILITVTHWISVC